MARHLECDAKLSAKCIGRGPRTGFRIFARFFKACPVCAARLDPVALQVTDLLEQLQEIILRRAAVIIRDAAAEGCPMLPMAVAEQLEQEFLPQADRSTDVVIRIAGIAARHHGKRRPFAA